MIAAAINAHHHTTSATHNICHALSAIHPCCCCCCCCQGTMGRVFVELLEGNCFSCRCCGTQLARQDGLLSKQFHSKNGPAWLFGACANVVAGPAEERLMTTGMHVVADISCARCLNVVGWKYEAAHETSQKYKEGKFIIERIHVVESSSRDSSTGSPRSPPRFAFQPARHPLGDSSSASETGSF